MPIHRASLIRFACLTFLVGSVCFPVNQALAAEALHEVIDQQIQQNAGGAMAPAADDAEFLRRATLDLTGKIPTADAVRKFLDDKAPEKRTRLIDSLLASEDYPRRMRKAMTVMLLERRLKQADPGWNRYLEESFQANKPWNQLVAELLFPDDKPELAPAKQFLSVAGRQRDPHQQTQDVARLFLGRDILCSQCHDHPVVGDFAQSEYFGLFSYLQDKPEKASSTFESVFVPGEKTTGPRLPGLQEVSVPTFEKNQQEEAKAFRPRLLLARDLPTAENGLFVRNSVNRFWFLFMGRGLVHPLNLIHGDNPPSHPELLKALADDFVAHKFDVKHLIREIMLSATYQRSSQLPAGVMAVDCPPESYRVAIAKPLTPEQMAWSTMLATGNLERIKAAPVPEKSTFSQYDYINGRIESPPDNLPDTLNLFVDTFCNPPGEPEVDFTPSMEHSLFLSNERLVLDWLRPHPGNLVERLAKVNDDAQVAQELYLTVLSRMPGPADVELVREYLGASQNRTAALSDLAWALLTSAEFRLNH